MFLIITITNPIRLTISKPNVSIIIIESYDIVVIPSFPVEYSYPPFRKQAPKREKFVPHLRAVLVKIIGL